VKTRTVAKGEGKKRGGHVFGPTEAHGPGPETENFAGKLPKKEARSHYELKGPKKNLF